jgi:hypothetical protein
MRLHGDEPRRPREGGSVSLADGLLLGGLLLVLGIALSVRRSDD